MAERDEGLLYGLLASWHYQGPLTRERGLNRVYKYTKRQIPSSRANLNFEIEDPIPLCFNLEKVTRGRA